MSLYPVSQKDQAQYTVPVESIRLTPSSVPGQRQYLAQAAPQHKNDPSSVVTPEKMKEARELYAKTLIFLNDLCAKLEQEGSSAAAGAKKFKQLMDSHGLMFTDDDDHIPASTVFSITDKNGLPSINIHMTCSLRFFKNCLERAQKDPFYADHLAYVIIKEGATIDDLMKSPNYYMSSYKLRGSAPLDKMDDESVKRQAATNIEMESVGYFAAMDFLREKGISTKDIEKRGQVEPDLQIAGSLRTVHDMLTLLQGKNGKSWSDTIRQFVFLDHIAGINKPLYKRIMQICIKEGKITLDPATGKAQGNADSFDFLYDKKYIGR